ncbi:hypothetical protein SKAU_G00129540 [Synaphobranchus kaupii]|uniref:Uncharacterized protein n=1 Tax=Synaphobranchus kaupii TaxID=118154 RepID=A0A9Q1FQA9_SYNKA|nr:hypothetical protein SKAU_G00129540 [Synaphobranchus kaupii]
MSESNTDRVPSRRAFDVRLRWPAISMSSEPPADPSRAGGPRLWWPALTADHSADSLLVLRYRRRRSLQPCAAPSKGLADRYPQLSRSEPGRRAYNFSTQK